MSFSVSIGSGEFEWIGRTKDVFSGLFAQRRNIVNPRYLGMLLEILRFQKAANADLVAAALRADARRLCRGGPLFPLLPRPLHRADGRGDLVDAGRADARLPGGELRLVLREPQAAALDRPVWRTVAGGSRSYVEKLTAPFRDRIRTGDPVESDHPRQVRGHAQDPLGRGGALRRIVLACHSDEGSPSSRTPTRMRPRCCARSSTAQRRLPPSGYEPDAATPRGLGGMELPAGQR